MKTCFKCNQAKPIEEFYPHSQMADGRLGKCKECTKNDVRRDRQEKPNAQLYDKRRYRENPERRTKIYAICARNRQRWPNKHRAHNLVASALKCGRLTKPSACSICGTISRRIEGHHPDYNKPLDEFGVALPAIASWMAPQNPFLS